MNIIKETTLPPAANCTEKFLSTIIFDIDNQELLTRLKGPPHFAADDKIIQKCIVALLTNLKSRLSHRKNVVLNLNLSQLMYPLHLWEETLFVAAQQVNFPFHVYITEQGTADRVHYTKNNRLLQKFVCQLAVERPTSQDPAAFADDNEWENLLKRTIMIIMTQYGFNEQDMERSLARTHNLKDLIHYCETRKKSST